MFQVIFETKPPMGIEKEREEGHYIMGNSRISDCQVKTVCIISRQIKFGMIDIV